MSRLKKEYEQVVLLLNDVPSWVLAVFTAGCIAMNLLANKSINTGIKWIALDCGILVSWIAFMSMDMIVKRYGAKASIMISVVALVINLLFAFLFQIAAAVSGVWGESFVADNPDAINAALNNTFAGTPYIIFGSSVAFIVSAVVNSLLNEAIGKLKSTDDFVTFALRAYVSTFIGQFVDNFTFAMIVSINFFGWTLVQCISCSLIGAIFELVMEVAFSPIGYKVTQIWSKQGVGRKYRTMYTDLECSA